MIFFVATYPPDLLTLPPRKSQNQPSPTTGCYPIVKGTLQTYVLNLCFVVVVVVAAAAAAVGVVAAAVCASGGDRGRLCMTLPLANS